MGAATSSRAGAFALVPAQRRFKYLILLACAGLPFSGQ
jgi:hypothetical protein